MAKGHGKRVPRSSDLNITSMMDMFTIILVFLLKSFSAEGSLLTNADNLTLPNSESKKKPQEVSLQLAVTNDMVLVDNLPVVPTEDVRKIPSDDPDPVVGKLEEKLKVLLYAGRRDGPFGCIESVQGKIIIQVDKNMDFDVLFKIMNTCGKVGYNNMNFAVMERGE